MRAFKSALTVLICLILALFFTACSSVDPNYGVSDKAVSEETENEEEKSNYDENTKIMSSDRVMSTYFDISLFDEENYSEIYLGKNFGIDAVYDGESIPVPSKLEDMIELGWSLAEGNEYNENSLVFAYETIDAVFQNENGLKIKAQFYNSSRSSVKLSKCYVVKFRIENDFYQDSSNYKPFNVNGITNTMAITDVIDTLGTPSHFYEVSEDNYYLDYFITKRDRRNGITVYINPADDIITAIEFSFYK